MTGPPTVERADAALDRARQHSPCRREAALGDEPVVAAHEGLGGQAPRALLVLAGVWKSPLQRDQAPTPACLAGRRRRGRPTGARSCRRPRRPRPAVAQLLEPQVQAVVPVDVVERAARAVDAVLRRIADEEHAATEHELLQAGLRLSAGALGRRGRVDPDQPYTERDSTRKLGVHGVAIDHLGHLGGGALLRRDGLGGKCQGEGHRRNESEVLPDQL